MKKGSNEYLWYCVEGDQMVVIDQRPDESDLHAPHKFTMVSTIDGQEVMEWFGTWFYIGEV